MAVMRVCALCDLEADAVSGISLPHRKFVCRECAEFTVGVCASQGIIYPVREKTWLERWFG